MDKEVLQKFFFEAMRHSCRFDIARNIVLGPGRPRIEFMDDFFRFEEWYDVSRDGSMRLDGERKIFFLGESSPAWSMQYRGYWREEDISFLHRALLEEYKDDHFTGGRGPNRYSEDKLTYENRTFPSKIDKSCGHEKVYRKEGELFMILGHYIYFGGTSESFLSIAA